MSNEPNTDHSKEGKNFQQAQTFDPQHVSHLQESNVCAAQSWW